MKIGFIGQGWIGRNYANDFEARGYDVVRYAKEPDYSKNLPKLQTADYIFIAVPTPTTPSGFDYSIVREVLSLVPSGKVAIIKSTLLPGTTDELQSEFPNITVIHSPEFLTEKTAAADAAAPNRNIIGLTDRDKNNTELAKKILAILPKAQSEFIVSAKEAELIKYAGNCFLFTKVVFFNLIYDLANSTGLNYESIKNAVVADPRIGHSHTDPVNVDKERGAGGHCFIKDTEAFRQLYIETVGDAKGNDLLTALVEKNNDLLMKTNKDMSILKGVYGDPVQS